MRKAVGWIMVLGVLVAARGFGQPPVDERRGPPGPPREVERRLQDLGVAEREAEADYQAAVRKIELRKRQLELEEKERDLGRKPVLGGCPMAAQWPQHGHFRLMRMMMAGCAVLHILLAVWVYQDIRRRNAGSGIWIVIVLIAGLLGALVYAVARLGDKKEG